jgi:dipeptidyl aminopeptidase/acylaminoacyl peptidase
MGAGLSNLMSDQGQNDIPRCNDEYYDKPVYEDPERYLRRSAVTHMGKARTPTLILHGEKDERVAIPQAWEMYRGLKWAGVETQFVTYPREPHTIGEKQHQIDLLERVLGWFERFLGTEPTVESRATSPKT